MADFDEMLAIGVPAETPEMRLDADMRKLAAVLEAANRPDMRPMTEADIPSVVEIENRSFTKEAYPEQVFRDWLAHGLTGTVVERGEKVAAYLLDRDDDKLPGFRLGQSLAVHPDHRREGLGETLMRDLMTKHAKVSAQVDTKNAASKGMLKKLGFKTVKTYKEETRRAHLMKYEPPEKAAELTLAELKTQSGKTDTDPTDAQKESGNYKKGRVKWKGLTLAIENPKGTVRKGKGWQTTMQDHYGYFAGSESRADGDAVDFFLNEEHLDSEIVFIVNQRKKDGSFDEGKVILGCIAEDAAVKTYLRNYSRGWTGLGSIVALTLPQFKRWLTHGDTSRPLRDSDVSVKTGAARATTFAGVPDLVTDERPVPQQEEQAVLLLRSPRHHGLSKMAGQLLGVLRGHGAEAGRDGAGPQGQRQELHSGELSVGNAHRSIEKQAERAEVHVQWQNLNFAAVGGSSWHATDPSAYTSPAIRLDAGAGVHDAVKCAEANVTFDHTPRTNADTTGVGQGNGYLAGDDRLSSEQGLAGGTGLNVVIDRPKGFKKTFVTKAGPKELEYPLDYGYFPGTINPEDNEDADVFMGTGGPHHGRFMKGKPGPDGAMVPDERKWYAGLHPEEYEALKNWWETQHDAGLTWDWTDLGDRQKLLADAGVGPVKKANSGIENSPKHILISGHSGAGKSTLSDKMHTETGYPVVSLDKHPLWAAWKAQDDTLDPAEANRLRRENNQKIVADVLATTKVPSIIEGTQLLHADPELVSPHRRILLDPKFDDLVTQRLGRDRTKPKFSPEGMGLPEDEWAEKRRAMAREIAYIYRPYIPRWRSDPGVEVMGRTKEGAFYPIPPEDVDEPRLFLVKRAADEHDHPFTICIDLDGTLAEQEVPFNVDSIGEPIERALAWVRRFRKAGARLIIFTVRGDNELVKDWLEEHDVPFDYINENPDQPEGSSGKIFADIYYDDRAIDARDHDTAGPEVLERMRRGEKIDGKLLLSLLEEADGERESLDG